MKKLFLISLLISTTMFAAGELSNRRAPGFSIVDVNQQQHDLADYRGKYVLLDFMQTGCPHCIKFAEILEKLSIQYRGKVEAISIVLPPDNIQTVRTYIKTHNVTIPVLFDSGQVTASYLRLTPATPRIYFPHLFIVNPAGRIVNDWGYTSDGKADDIFSGDGLAKELERLLGGKK